MVSDIIKPYPVENEYRKTNTKPEDIEKLRKWLETQPHLPAKYITDLDLAVAYYACNYSAEVAKQVLDLSFTLRSLFSSFFKDRRLDNRLMKTLNVILALPLETRAYDNSVVGYFRLLDYDTKNFVLSDTIRLLFMLLDLWLYENGSAPGLFILIDFDRVALGHLAKLDIVIIQQFLYYLQEAMFVKIKGVHFMNAPPFIDRLVMLIKPFLNRSILDVLHIHYTGSRTIEKFLPIESLPKDAGGQFMTFKQGKEYTIKRLKANEQIVLDEEKKRVVESLRPGKQKTIADIFGGIEGSFKKLDID